MLSGGVFKDKFPGETSYIETGLAFHSIFFVISLGGIIFGHLIYRNSSPLKIEPINYGERLSGASVILIYIFILIGVASTYQNISFFGDVASYYTASDLGNARENFELSSSEGGAPGIYKLLSHALNGVFAALCIIYGNLTLRDRAGFSRRLHLKFLLMISTVGLAFKVSVSLDRATVLLFILGLLYIIIRKKPKTAVFLVLLSTGIALLNFVSSFRISDYGIFDFIALYSALGLSNFGQIIQKDICFDLGAQTLFSALNGVTTKLFEFGVAQSCLGDSWSYNPAQYFFSHVFLDFSYFGLIFVFFLGFFLVYSDRRLLRGSLFHESLTLHLSCAIIMMVGVTTLRGVEFFFAFFVSFVILKLARLKT